MERPTLIEPGVRTFFDAVLKKCQGKKEYYYNLGFNIALLLLIVGIVGGFMYYKYKGKPTLIEKKIRQEKEADYILSKIKLIQQQKDKEKYMITTLPSFNENELLLKNYYNNKI